MDILDGKASVIFMFAHLILFVFVFIKMQSFMQNSKTLNLALKMSYLGTFRQKSAALNFSFNFLTNTVYFGIGSAFSRNPGYTFSEAPCQGPCPGLLYKVCRFFVLLFCFTSKYAVGWQ